MPLDQSVLAEVLGKVVSEFPCLSEVVLGGRGVSGRSSHQASLSSSSSLSRLTRDPFLW